MPSAIIIDTETTSNKDLPERPNEVIELAYFPLVEPGRWFSSRYKPRHPPSWGALATHGISMVELQGCPPSSQARNDLPAVDYWIGHNIDFDWRVLGSPPVKRICTLALSRSLWPELDSHTLTVMMYFIHGATPQTRELVSRAHGAAADCEFVLSLFTVIQSLLKTTDLDQLWELSEDARVPRMMTFGKFAGQPISAVDRGYANWYRKQPDPDPYLIEAFRRAGLC
jgi:exodeoxyribonuclease X